jgi:hypothetical protein
MRRAGFFTHVAPFLAAVLWLASCATEVGDIDRTDPNKIKKADLKGVWYYVSTVIDAPNPSPFTFNGEMNFGGGVKVVFDIQEDYLVAYPTTEITAVGAEEGWHVSSIRNYWDEGKSDEFIEMYVGQPVAAFQIDKQFDVIRQYNAQTGEQNNVIVEDTSDKLWYQREYLRVNWTQNKVKDLMFLAAVEGSPTDYYVQEYEEDNPDAFEMTADSINFVNRIFAQPVGPEACSVYGIASNDCAGAVIKVRHSFKRADPNGDYVPLYYPETDQQDKFGFFLTEHYGYDYDHGLLLANKVYLINRWNIWKNSRDIQDITDPDTGEKVACKVDADCTGKAPAGVHSTHCWLDNGWFSEGHCVTWDTLDYKDRTVQPVIYHVSAQWPKELERAIYVTNRQYSDSLKDTAAWLKLYSEKGIGDLRYCDTNADCAAHALVETEIAHTHGRSCDAVEDCLAGVPAGQKPLYSCPDGYCLKAVACAADKPCALGQDCVAGVCKDATDSPVVTEIRDTGAYTFYMNVGAEGAVKTQVSEDDSTPKIPAGKALIRVVNLNTAVGPVTLTDQYGAICDVEAAFAATEDAYLVPGNCFVSTAESVRNIQVKDQAGALVGTVFGVRIAKDEIVTVVISGNATLKGVLAFNITVKALGTKGIRFVHAFPGRGGVDFAVNGGLRASDLRFGQASVYTGMRKGNNRITVISHGEPGDVTCYSNNGVGTCTGWRTELEPEDMARVKEIKAALPDMFVVCDNVFSGDACDPNEAADGAPTGKESVDREARNDCRYWWFDQAVSAWRNPCKEVPNPYDIKKHGDIRYSFLYWVGEAQAASPLGYGPSAADPKTGQIYHACANIYGADMLTYAQYSRDLLKLSTGELSPDDIASAEYIKEYIENNPPDNGYGSLYAPLLDKALLDKKATENLARRPPMKRFWATPQEETVALKQLNDPVVKRMATDPKFAWKMAVDSLVDGVSPKAALARMSLVKGTWIEKLLINEEVKAASSGCSLLHDHDAEKAAADKMSPLYWGTKDFAGTERDRLIKLGEKSYCMAESDEPNVLGTALRIAEWCDNEANRAEYGGDKDNCIYWEITQEMFEGTLLHEVGHTVGLRHNFTASTDVYNYFDPYYSKRDLDYKKCSMDGSLGCVFFDQRCQLLCKTNADCYQPGSVCKSVEVDGATKKACVDEHGDLAGTCMDKVKERKYCDTAADCAGALDLDAAEVSCQKGPEQSSGLCAVAGKPDNFGGTCPQGQKESAGYCVIDDKCDKGAGVCQKDGGQACTADAQCQVTWTIWEGPEAEIPVKVYMPRPYLTENEASNGRTEYQYSSLMDYGGAINFDLYGLGKYDTAALRFGYGELVDIYTDKRHLEQALVKVQRVWSGDTLEQSSSFVYDTEIHSQLIFSPYMTLFDFIGIKENLSRIPAPYRKARLEKKMNLSNDRGLYDITYLMVPYKAKYDGWMGSFETYIFDMGADLTEIVGHSWSKLHDYYVYDAFKRDRFGAFRYGNPLGYYTRIVERWLPPMQDAGRYYALYYNSLRAYAESRDLYFNNILAFGHLKVASDYSIQKLSQLVVSPAPGSYSFVDDGTGDPRYINFSLKSGQPGSELDIPIGDGKFPFTTYYADAGYNYFSHAAWIGSFWEKVAAAWILTDSTSYFLGDYIGEQVSVGLGASVGFNTVYYTQLTNLMAGLIVGDRSWFAPYVEDGQFKPFDIHHPWEAEGKPRVETSIESLSMKAYMALYGYSYIPAGFDPGFIDSLFICIKGSGECYDMASGALAPEVIEFTDPWSKKTYQARTANYDPARINASFDFLTKLNALKAEYDQWEWGESADTDAQKAAIENKLHEQIELLDLLVSFNRLFGNLIY